MKNINVNLLSYVNDDAELQQQFFNNCDHFVTF